MAAETSNSGALEVRRIGGESAAVLRRAKAVNRLFDRITGAAADGKTQILVRGGLFGLAPTTPDAESYAELGDKLRAHGVGIVVMRQTNDYAPMPDVNGQIYVVGAQQRYDIALITRFNQMDYEIPADFPGVQVYPPQGS